MKFKDLKCGNCFSFPNSQVRLIKIRPIDIIIDYIVAINSTCGSLFSEMDLEPDCEVNDLGNSYDLIENGLNCT